MDLQKSLLILRMPKSTFSTSGSKLTNRI
jgi:hypothetical protein